MCFLRKVLDGFSFGSTDCKSQGFYLYPLLHPPPCCLLSSIPLFPFLASCVQRMIVVKPEALCLRFIPHLNPCVSTTDGPFDCTAHAWRWWAVASLSLSHATISLSLSESSITMVMSSSSCDPAPVSQSMLITGGEETEEEATIDPTIELMQRFPSRSTRNELPNTIPQNKPWLFEG